MVSWRETASIWRFAALMFALPSEWHAAACAGHQCFGMRGLCSSALLDDSRFSVDVPALDACLHAHRQPGGSSKGFKPPSSWNDIADMCGLFAVLHCATGLPSRVWWRSCVTMLSTLAAHRGDRTTGLCVVAVCALRHVHVRARCLRAG